MLFRDLALVGCSIESEQELEKKRCLFFFSPTRNPLYQGVSVSLERLEYFYIPSVYFAHYSQIYIDFQDDFLCLHPITCTTAVEYIIMSIKLNSISWHYFIIFKRLFEQFSVHEGSAYEVIAYYKSK